MMKIQTYKNGALAAMEKNGAYWKVYARDSAGEIIDKVLCDDYRDALDYYKSFKLIAKNG